MVKPEEHKYILRVYYYGWRSKEEIDFELDLLTFLHQGQAQIAYPIAKISGDLTTAIATPEGTRYAVLFSYASFDFDQCGYGWRAFDIGKFINTSIAWQIDCQIIDAITDLNWCCKFLPTKTDLRFCWVISSVYLHVRNTLNIIPNLNCVAVSKADHSQLSRRSPPRSFDASAI